MSYKNDRFLFYTQLDKFFGLTWRPGTHHTSCVVVRLQVTIHSFTFTFYGMVHMWGYSPLLHAGTHLGYRCVQDGLHFGSLNVFFKAAETKPVINNNNNLAPHGSRVYWRQL